MGAVRMGTAGPPELQEFLVDREFYRELGWSAEYRKSRPLRQVQDYAAIISVIRREEEARARARR